MLMASLHMALNIFRLELVFALDVQPISGARFLKYLFVRNSYLVVLINDSSQISKLPFLKGAMHLT